MLALDTNTLVFKGIGGVAQRFQATPPREVGIPAVVLYELEFGITRSRSLERRRGLEVLVQLVRILPFDAASARCAAGARAQLEALGTPIGPLDTLIAGTALAHSATLVTHNTREFSRVPGLSIVDWVGL